MSQFRTNPFPFCTKPLGSHGYGTLHPIAVPITKIAEWYWRVKLWGMTITTEWGALSWTFQFQLNGPTIPNDEIVLARCIQPGEQFSFRTVFSGSDGDIDPGLIAGDIYLFTEHGEPGLHSIFDTESLMLEEGIYWPQILISVRASKDGFDSTAISNSEGTFGASTLATIDGYQVPMLRSTVGDNIHQVEITPTEWWPYERASGGHATYSTMTGEIIVPDYRAVSP